MGAYSRMRKSEDLLLSLASRPRTIGGGAAGIIGRGGDLCLDRRRGQYCFQTIRSA